MPFKFTDNKVAVEMEELVPRFWNKLNSLQKELRRYENKPWGIKRLQRGGNGSRLLIDFDTLKPEIQEALGDPRKADHPLVPFFEFDAEAVRYYSKFKRENSGTYLSPEEQERYIVNASVLQALIKLEQARISIRMNMRGSKRGIGETLIHDAATFQNSLQVLHSVQHSLPQSKRLLDLMRDFKTLGYYVVINDPTGARTQNARKVDQNLEMLFNALFKRQLHKPTPTEVAKQYQAFLDGRAEVFNEDTGEVFEPSEFKTLSQSTIINYINKWENRIATDHYRSADRQQFMAKYKPHHQMDLPVYSGSLLSIDDRQPPFMYDKGKRVWFYIGMDVASQFISAVVYGKTKEGIILDFYRQLVRNYTQWGIPLPKELECESSLNSSFKNTILRPGAMFENVRIEANNARGKYIERAFGKLRYEVEKQAYGWIGRPFAKSEANQSRPGENKIIPYDQLVNDRMIDLENWNNMPHPQNQEISRFQYFCQNQLPGLHPTNWNAILPHIGYKQETSCRLGYVALQGKPRAIAENDQILTGSALIEKMRVIEGRELDVYWLDDNEGKVLKAMAYLRGTDRLVCEIMEMPRYNRATAERTPKCEAAYRLQSSYVATVESFAKSQRQSIDNIQIVDNTERTINSEFKFPNIKRLNIVENEPAHIFEDDNDQDQNFVYIPNAEPSWRNSYR